MTIDYSKLPPECDPLCEYRSCLHKGENKEPFVPGRGYTSYYKKPKYVCMTRHLRGCPTIAGLDGHSRRPLPDIAVMLDHFEAEAKAAPATKKVKRLIRETLLALRCLSEHAAPTGKRRE